MNSVAGRPAYGPYNPYGVIAATIAAGWAAASSAMVRPSTGSVAMITVARSIARRRSVVER
ncbi:MAG: hypothetical protein V9E89_01725 [Ilumatobacteraceae bacterium]